MDRLAACLGLLAAAAALGALAVGELVLVPGLGAATGYVDANLAKSLTAPLHLRCAEIVLVASVVTALASGRMATSRAATTAALGAVGCAALYRMVLVPRLYAAWARADLVAGRPVARIADAEQLAGHTVLLAASIGALVAAVVVLTAWSRAPRATKAPARAADPLPAAPATSSG